jgi:hypothetical protein
MAERQKIFTFKWFGKYLNYYKENEQAVPAYATKIYRGRRDITPLIFKLGTRRK